VPRERESTAVGAVDEPQLPGGSSETRAARAGATRYPDDDAHTARETAATSEAISSGVEVGGAAAYRIPPSRKLRKSGSVRRVGVPERRVPGAATIVGVPRDRMVGAHRAVPGS
jgi:hypothetical protein